MRTWMYSKRKGKMSFRKGKRFYDNTDRHSFLYQKKIQTFFLMFYYKKKNEAWYDLKKWGEGKGTRMCSKKNRNQKKSGSIKSHDNDMKPYFSMLSCVSYKKRDNAQVGDIIEDILKKTRRENKQQKTTKLNTLILFVAIE